MIAETGLLIYRELMPVRKDQVDLQTRDELAMRVFERPFRERGVPASIRFGNGVSFASPRGLFQLSRLFDVVAAVGHLDRAHPARAPAAARAARKHATDPETRDNAPSGGQYSAAAGVHAAMRYAVVVVTRRFVVLAIVFAFTSLNAFASMKGYLPLNETELGMRFPQHVLRRNFVQEMSARVGTTTVRFLESANEIQFAGKDLAREPWKVTADAMRGGALYSSDLDHNGFVDLIYASYIGGNGLAPPMHVLTLLFDSSGRPVPSEMDSYFEIDSHGVKDLVDLDGDGRAELIRQSFDDGYWITSLYEARDAHWNLIHGRHAAREYPMYTRFTNRSNRVPTKPGPGRNPIEDDLSNAMEPGTPEVTIEHLKWANVQQSENAVLQLSDGRRCEEIGWYSSALVVLDGPSGRMGATIGAPEEARQLLESVVRRRLPVRISGNRRNRESTAKNEHADCSPEMVWADDAGKSNDRMP